MREKLSQLIVEAASDPRTMVLSGDHGYALFDAIRRERPDQFINVGVAEQSMVGVAAGLARVGMRPIVYGLAAFVPIRVLEQIKLDVCLSDLPVIFLGDGAGLVYATLGASHQCAEDIACLAPLPHMRIYSPCDQFELEACFREALATPGPAYLRIGKSDRPSVLSAVPASTDAHFVARPHAARDCLIATGSMVAPARALAEELGCACLSVPRLKPWPGGLIEQLKPFRQVVTIEEHSVYGGLHALLLHRAALEAHPSRRYHAISLKDQFSRLCGSYQYALSEHALDDVSLKERVRALLAAPETTPRR